MGELERRQCNSVTGSACSTSDLKRQVRLGPNKRFELENWRNKQGRDKNHENLTQVYSAKIRLYADQTLLVFVVGGRSSSMMRRIFDVSNKSFAGLGGWSLASLVGCWWVFVVGGGF